MGPILFLTGIFFLSFVSRVVFSPLMPTIENQMGITHAQAGSLALIQKEGRFRGEPPRPAALADLSSRTLFWVMIVLFCLALSGGVGIYAVLPLYLVKERGLDLANTLLSVSRVSGLVMVFLAGWLTDRVGEKRTIHLALLMAGAATALLALVSGGPLVVMVFVQPAIVSCFFPAGFKALSQIVPPGTRSLATG